MSATAAWSYTATATLWPLTGRDDWSGVPTFGPATVIACDYKAEVRQARDDRGAEFVSRQTVYTEHSAAKMGDRLKLGSHSGTPPADAEEVRAVLRFADTFSRVADDYQLLT